LPKKTAKRLLRHIVPPVAWTAARKVREAVTPPSSGWFICDEDPAKAFAKEHTHWKGEDILHTYSRRWPGFEQVLSTSMPPIFASETETLSFDPTTEVSSDAHLLRHNTILGLVFAVARAARQRPKISMLDWGGGVGHQYGLVHSLLPALELDCTCFDLPVSVKFGSERFPEVHFTSDFKCLEQKYDLVVANNSLQYFEHWQRMLEQLAGAATDFCFLTMVPLLIDGPTQLMTQRWINPDGSRYSEAEWFFSRSELLRAFPSDAWTLQRELICGMSPMVHGKGMRAEYRGFLFERKAKTT
jgi:putative methyltransferase (TIGR04325 family)